MSSDQSKRLTLNELLECPVCKSKYENTLPKILPCGKTLCLNCINEMKSNNYAIKCKLCSNEHRIPRASDLPTNEILLILINSADMISNTNVRSVRDTLKNDSPETNREQINLLLKEIDLNTEKLNSSIKNSRNNIKTHFDTIETEINRTSELLMKELKSAHELLLKELEMHRKNAFDFFDQGLQETSKSFTKSKQDLVEESKSARSDEVSRLVKIANDFNKKIYQTLIYFENLVRNNLQYESATNPIDFSQALGSLTFKKLSLPEQAPSKSIKFNEKPPQLTNTAVICTKLTSINYKIPINVKNFFMYVYSNETILKIMETAVVDDGFNYVIKLQVKSLDGAILVKSSENLGSNRIKRIQTCNHNRYVLVLLKNRFLDNYSLMLFNSELMHTKSVELHYKPDEIFMNDTGIYIKPYIIHPSFIHKYNYKLDHVKSIGQCVDDENKLFYFSKAYQVIGFEKEKCFYVDNDTFKIKVMNELNGRVIKSIDVDETNNILVQIDSSNERVMVLNRKYFVLNVYDWSGLFLYKKKIDSQIQSIDYFYQLNEEKFAVIDQKNNFIHIF